MSWGERFHSAAWMELEERHLWPQSWLLIGRPSLAPGQWRGFSHGRHGVLLSRGEQLHAHQDSCPHRGTQICGDHQVEGPIRCPYHGWTFSPEGQPLRGEAPLTPMALRERWGFVWVCPGEAQPAAFEPLDPLLAHLESWHISADLTVPLRCNWKLSVEVHLEGLHLPTLHPEIADRVDWAGARAESIGRHGVMRVPPKDPRIGANTLVQIFPNVQINLHPQQALVFRHRPHPTDPGRCFFDQLVLVPTPQPAPPHEVVGIDDPRIGPVTAADLHIAERLSAGLLGGGPQRPAWTESESLVRDFHEHIERALGLP